MYRLVFRIHSSAVKTIVVALHVIGGGLKNMPAGERATTAVQLRGHAENEVSGKGGYRGR